MPLNVAFYGAGARARLYLDALARRSDIQVAAVCDLDRRAAEQSAAGWGARVFLSYEAMLEEVLPDALWVCVAAPLQGDVLLRAAAQGVPFFVEPPGAMDHERARLYGARVAEARLVTAVGYPTRYTDLAQEAQGYLGANPVLLALGWWLRPWGEDAPLTAAGLLWNEACRMVDVLRFFCGEVVRVQALHAGAEHGGMVVQMQLAGGGVAVLTCAAFARPEPRVELELLGEGWALGFSDDLATLRLAERDKTTILRRLNSPADDHVAAFLDAIEEDDPKALPTGYAEALRTLAVCQAATLSAQRGQAVAVEEVLGG